ISFAFFLAALSCGRGFFRLGRAVRRLKRFALQKSADHRRVGLSILSLLAIIVRDQRHALFPDAIRKMPAEHSLFLKHANRCPKRVFQFSVLLGHQAFHAIAMPSMAAKPWPLALFQLPQSSTAFGASEDRRGSVQLL